MDGKLYYEGEVVGELTGTRPTLSLGTFFGIDAMCSPLDSFLNSVMAQKEAADAWVLQTTPIRVSGTIDETMDESDLLRFLWGSDLTYKQYYAIEDTTLRIAFNRNITWREAVLWLHNYLLEGGADGEA